MGRFRFRGSVAEAFLPALALLALPTSGHAATKVDELAPSSKWNVDYDDRSCVLQRAFGPEDDPVLLRMVKFEPGDHFQLLAAGKRFLRTKQGDRMTIRYGSGEGVHKVENVLVGDGAKGLGTVFVTSTRILPARFENERPVPVTVEEERAVTRITMSPVRGHELALLTGPLDKAFAAWRTCTERLVRKWGLDPAAQAALKRPATPSSDPGKWLLSTDYPLAQLMFGKQALVNFRLNVGKDGVPTACEVQKSYSDKAFDDRSCAMLMKRARFTPALDAQGQPIESYYVNRIVWKIGSG